MLGLLGRMLGLLGRMLGLLGRMLGPSDACWVSSDVGWRRQSSIAWRTAAAASTEQWIFDFGSPPTASA